MQEFIQTFIISMLAVLLIAVIFGVVFLLKSLGNIKRDQIERDDISSRLAVGQQVSLRSGILGTVVAIHSETIDLEVKSKAIIEAYITAVHEIL